MFSQNPPKPMQDAATVVLARPTKQGFEVFLVRRSSKSGFMAGAYVFPGGKLDARDFDFGPAHFGSDLEQLASRLVKTPGREFRADQANALVVAACRELFEEAGVLLATHRDGRPVCDSDAIWAQLQAQRSAVAMGSVTFLAMMEKYDLRLCVNKLDYWAHWVTPSAEKRRFDTRFFIAALPPGQSALQDNHETTDGRWLTPRAALKSQNEGALFLPPPTLRTLEDLEQFTSIDSLFEAARSEAPFPIMPKIQSDGSVVSIILPWDRDYSSLEGESLPFDAHEHRFVRSASRIVFDGEAWSSIDNRITQ